MTRSRCPNGDGILVAAKPAFAGALVADITSRSATQMVTVRPGVLPTPSSRHHDASVVVRPVGTRGRVRLLGERRDDDVETLARADVVIGVGAGVMPEEFEQLSPLAARLGAELAATRKVTDRGWAPRARQIGLTGRSIGTAPVHRAGPEREVQPHGGGPRRRDDPGRQHGPRRARLLTLRPGHRRRLARGRRTPPPGAAPRAGRRHGALERGRQVRL